MAKQCTKNYNACAQALFCSSNLLFGDILIAIVFCVSSPVKVTASSLLIIDTLHTVLYLTVWPVNKCMYSLKITYSKSKLFYLQFCKRLWIAGLILQISLQDHQVSLLSVTQLQLCYAAGIIGRTNMHMKTQKISLLSGRKNSAWNNRPQYEALGNKTHKLCSYSLKPHAVRGLLF